MKKITFDEEELFAIAVFEPDTRVNTIKRLERVLPELQDDPEMRDLIRSAREKLKKISDREYSLLDLDSYREELEWDMNEEETGIDAETADNNVVEIEKNSGGKVMSEGLNQYVVYRLKRALRETRTRRHQSYQYLQKYQMEVISDLYDQIYLSEFDPSLSPLQLRRQLEKELPADSAGETLAISDVLAITRYGITSAYYVDPDKMVSLTGFFHVPSSRELLTPETTDFQIEGRPGTWLVAEDIWIDGNHFFLMQNQFFGRKAACAVLDSRGHPAAEDTTNGFSDAVIKQIREYIHGQKSENKNSVPDEPPELEPIQFSDIDEKTDPLPAIEIVPDHTASEGLTLELKVTENQKPDSGDLEPVSNLGPVLNPEPDSRPNPVPDENKQKKKRRSGKVPLRYRSSVLERLHKYQMKLVKERRKKER